MSVKTKLQNVVLNILLPEKKSVPSRAYMLKYDALMNYPKK